VAGAAVVGVVGAGVPGESGSWEEGAAVAGVVGPVLEGLTVEAIEATSPSPSPPTDVDVIIIGTLLTVVGVGVVAGVVGEGVGGLVLVGRFKQASLD